MLRLVPLAALAAILAWLSSRAPVSAARAATCEARAGTDVQWLRLAPSDEQAALDRWCAAVGPPVRMAAVQPQDVFTGLPTIVVWNTHVGGGDLEALVQDLRAGRLSGGRPVTSFVLLLQEVYRAGGVPAAPTGLAWATGQHPVRRSGPREDIVTLARRLRLAALYVPSMRNGAPGATDEDRGNAILSTLPLSDPTAMELPLESQRRVALAATVTVTVGRGPAIPLRLVCTHFTNMVMHHLWVLSESGRLRQARALARALPPDGPLILGGDFNAWFGYRDAAYKEMARTVPSPASVDRRPTFGPMRLDHVLVRLPHGWRTSVRRADSRYGSDHYPLVATIDPAP